MQAGLRTKCTVVPTSTYRSTICPKCVQSCSSNTFSSLPARAPRPRQRPLPPDLREIAVPQRASRATLRAPVALAQARPPASHAPTTHRSCAQFRSDSSTLDGSPWIRRLPLRAVSMPQPSGTGTAPPLPTITGLDMPTVVMNLGKRALEWWQILLMALGCAFIFLIIVWLFRRRARSTLRRLLLRPLMAQRNVLIRNSPPHPATAPLGGRGGGGGWKWQFGHRKSQRVFYDTQSLPQRTYKITAASQWRKLDVVEKTTTCCWGSTTICGRAMRRPPPDDGHAEEGAGPQDSHQDLRT
ncbi:hypothetical protein BDN71DRAFT_1508856 [Pleurotus eryngii]|uniref:Uncharacterized protein n=1 Tax=Pleurotus eryngii TaxID=5323 RepID=A0A9P5ZTC0_PLEER|nr:hypothetical protein BDN71DRAFT_1508856 [Pleurotus eryngii]